MSRTFVILLAVALAAGATSTAFSSSGASTKPFTLVERATSQTRNDASPPGTSGGDVIATRYDLVQGGRKVGEAQGVCVQVAGDGADGSAECTQSFVLPRGRLVVERLRTSKPDTEVTAIVGGTGAYRKARGTVTLRELGATRFQATFAVSS